MTLDPAPHWFKVAISYVIVAALSPLIALGLTLEWWDRTTGPAPGDGWQRWFAWFPTRLGRWKGPLVWFEPIERSRWGDGYLCRRPGDTSILATWEMFDDEG